MGSQSYPLVIFLVAAPTSPGCWPLVASLKFELRIRYTSIDIDKLKNICELYRYFYCVDRVEKSKREIGKFITFRIECCTTAERKLSCSSKLL